MSAAERAHRLAPGARVVSGFHTISSEMLAVLDRPLRGDVLLCGDDADAKNRVGTIVRDIGLRPVDAGALVQSRLLEPLAGAAPGLYPPRKKEELGTPDAGGP